MVDHETKRVAEEGIVELQSLVPDRKIQIDQNFGEPRYSNEDQKPIKDLDGKIGENGWAKTPQGKIIVPCTLLWAVIMAEHRKTYWGTEALYKYLGKCSVARTLYTTIKQVTQQCEDCLQNNPQTTQKVTLRQIGKGNLPGQWW